MFSDSRPDGAPPADRPAAWTVIALVILAVATNSYLFAPMLVPTVTGETLLKLWILAGVVAAAGAALLGAALFLSWRAIRAAPRGSVQRYLRLLRVPIAIVLLTVALGSLSGDRAWADWLFEPARAAAAVLAGWFLARGGYSLWSCAAAGALLIVIDHVVVKTFAFALVGEWIAIGGVFLSFFMFAVVPMALAAAAGFVAARPQLTQT